MTKRFTTLSLLMAMLCALAACGGESGSVDTTASSDDVTTTVEETEPVINWESSGLPKKDYGGREFNILHGTIETNRSWKELAPESEVGDVLNDAIFQRTRKIEELYHIKVNVHQIAQGDYQTQLRKAVDAGDNAYDITHYQVIRQLPLAQEGYFLDWFDMPYTDTTAVWWDQSVNAQLTFGDNLYTMVGDVSPLANSVVYSLVFNKDMCTDLKLEMPYQYVLDGKWTIDRFNEYISKANHDVNGDSKMDFADRWGFFSQKGNVVFMYFSGGGRVTQMNAKGELELIMNSEKNIEMAIKALSTSIDASKTLFADQYVADNGGNWSAASSWFANGGALFRASSLEPVPRDYRSLDVNFGVIPFPKLDEQQKEHYTLASEFSSVWSVPVTADAEYVSLIMEALSAESVSTVTPAFYDKVLKGKALRDDESAAMLDILFKNKVFDPVHILNIGGFTGQLRSLETNQSTDVASAFKSIESSLSSALNEIIGELSA